MSLSQAKRSLKNDQPGRPTTASPVICINDTPHRPGLPPPSAIPVKNSVSFFFPKYFAVAFGGQEPRKSPVFRVGDRKQLPLERRWSGVPHLWPTAPGPQRRAGRPCAI